MRITGIGNMSRNIAFGKVIDCNTRGENFWDIPQRLEGRGYSEGRLEIRLNPIKRFARYENAQRHILLDDAGTEDRKIFAARVEQVSAKLDPKTVQEINEIMQAGGKGYALGVVPADIPELTEIIKTLPGYAEREHLGDKDLET